jgi:hypothetical protein
MAETERKETESYNPLLYIGKCMYSEIKERCSYTTDAKKQFKELLEESIPVLIAAATSGFVTTLIEYISEDSEYKEASQCGQAIVYAVLAYVVGYFLTIQLKQQLEFKSNRSSLIIEWIEKQELTEVLFGLFAENSAFAWREFINIFILKIIYLNYGGFGPSLGTWLLCFCIFSIIMCCSIYVLKSKLVSKDLQNLLLEFNSDAFSFPLAFSITVLIALGFTSIGANYTDNHGYLYEWKDDDNHDDSADSNSYYNLYAIIITILVALILVIEDRCCSIPHSNELEMELEFNNPRISSDRNDKASNLLHQGTNEANQGENQDQNITYQAILELWHNFLG